MSLQATVEASAAAQQPPAANTRNVTSAISQSTVSVVRGSASTARFGRSHLVIASDHEPPLDP